MRFLRIPFWLTAVLAFSLPRLAGAQAPPPPTMWVQQLTDPGPFFFNAFVGRIAADQAGNSYTVGAMQQQLITSLGTMPAGSFVIKHDSAGQGQWQQAVYNAVIDLVAVTHPQHVYTIGRHIAGAQFGGQFPQTDTGNYVANYRPDGTMRWVHNFRVTTNAQLHSSTQLINAALLPDAAGNCYAVMQYPQTPDVITAIDGFPVPPRTDDGPGFVVKLDSTGTTQWVVVLHDYLGGNGLPLIESAIADDAGNVFLSGNADDTLTVTSAAGTRLQITSPVARQSFTKYLLKISPAGAIAWSRKFTDWPMFTDPTANIDHLVTDPAGNLYAFGVTKDTLHYDGVVSDQAPGIGASFVLKISPTGQARWIRTFNPGNYTNVLVTGSAAGYARQGFFYVVDPVSNPPSPVPYTPGLLALDTAAHVVWTHALPDSMTYVSSVGIDALGQAYLVRPAVPGTSIDGHAITSAGFCVIGFQPPLARLTGHVYLDYNGNGQRDSGEPPFPQTVVLADTVRNLLGTAQPQQAEFRLYGPPGDYFLRLAAVPANYQLTQGSSGYVGNLGDISRVDTDRNFGLAALNNRPDLRLTLTPLGVARRGVALRYQAHLENRGTTTVSGAVTVVADPSAVYVGAQPAPTATRGDTVRWAFQNMAPFQARDFVLVTSLPVNLPLGQAIHTRGFATTPDPDVSPNNNHDDNEQLVVASSDPTDLVVNRTRLSPQEVQRGTPLDYTVRFQNVGSDTVSYLMIQDSLPGQQFLLATADVVAQSHNCEWDITADGQLVLRFPGVKLPPQAINAVGAQGFVRFLVEPKHTLPLGTLIPNTAHLSFNGNWPLATNGVTTLVQYANGLAAEPGATRLSLYPNPAEAAAPVILTADVPTAGRAQVRISDVLGRPVRQENTSATAGQWHYAVPTAALRAGVYVVRLTLPDGTTASRKLVVR